MWFAYIHRGFCFCQEWWFLTSLFWFWHLICGLSHWAVRQGTSLGSVADSGTWLRLLTFLYFSLLSLKAFLVFSPLMFSGTSLTSVISSMQQKLFLCMIELFCSRWLCVIWILTFFFYVSCKFFLAAYHLPLTLPSAV